MFAPNEGVAMRDLLVPRLFLILGENLVMAQ